ncbi:MAG: hypothetical protein JXR37_27715 [Kiritimatiellae bacterium]|nr:hypothetical protein [Kiritimatiellia bacterium]
MRKPRQHGLDPYGSCRVPSRANSPAEAALRIRTVLMSMMIRNVIDNKGGLHNRVTRTIRLEALDLAATRRYVESRQERQELKEPGFAAWLSARGKRARGVCTG